MYDRVMRRSRPARGFTAVELAVCIAVGLLVLGILLATVPERLEKRRRYQCLNNLKQIGLGIRLYAGDYGERCPCDPKGTTLGSFGLLKNQYQTSYVVWVCPSDRGIRPGSSGGRWTSANLSYAYGGFTWSESLAPDTPIACDRTSGDVTSATPYATNQWTHKTAGGSVLGADGHVSWQKTFVPPIYRAKNP